MRSFLVGILFLLAVPASADDFALQLMAGAKKAAPHFAADVDWSVGENQSLGAYLLYGGEKEGVTDAFWSLGLDVKVHFGPEQWKVYIGPGFGLAQFQEGQNDKDLTFGSIMKVGALYNFTPSFAFGLEHMIYINWFSDDARIGFSRSSAAFRFTF